MKIIIKNLKPIISIIPISLMIASCDTDANLKKVRKFSDNADLIAQTLPAITDDFYESCLRKAHYEVIDISQTNKGLNPKKQQIISKIKDLNRQLNTYNSSSLVKQNLKELEQKLELNLPSDSTQKVSDPLNNRLGASSKCSQTQNQESRQDLGSLMDKGNSIIILYMKKLGTLASDDLINFDSEFTNLGTSLTSLNSELRQLFSITSSDPATINRQITSGSSLASFIVNQSFENERIETLDEVVTIANEPLQNYAPSLQTIVERVYINQYLRSEETGLNEYYYYYIQEILETQPSNNGDSVINLTRTLIDMDRDWNQATAEIQERRELADFYVNLLQSVVDGHEQLAAIYNNGKQPSSKEIKEVVDTNSKAVTIFVDKAKALNKKYQEKID